MSSFCKCKSYSHFFSKNISIYAIFNEQSFNDTLTNNILSFEQLGPGIYLFLRDNKHVCCGYSLEAPCCGMFNEYPQHIIVKKEEKYKHFSVGKKCHTLCYVFKKIVHNSKFFVDKKQTAD